MRGGVVRGLSDLFLTYELASFQITIMCRDLSVLTFSLSEIQVFGEFQIWLAAENGMYLRRTSGEWTPTMEHLNMDWKESVQVEVVANLLFELNRELGGN